jgi:uncharacterized protein
MDKRIVHQIKSMDTLLSKKQGVLLVKKARQILANELGANLDEIVLNDSIFQEPRGLFVTLSSYPSHNLRGCIGFVHAHKPLKEALCDAAIHAGIHDMRFESVRLSDIDKIVFEVSILTPPSLIEHSDETNLLDKIKIGRDGLIIEYGGSSGLLLPQVPIEWNWSKVEYLEGLCNKAALPRDMWKSANVRISAFQAQIFAEDSPNGQIIEKKLVR